MPNLSTKERKTMFNKPLSYLILFASWIDVEWTDTFSSNLKNKYELLGTKSKQISKMYFCLGLLRKLREDKLRNTVKEFRDKLKDTKIILNEIKKLELLREQKINEKKKETKRKLNMLDDEITDILEKLDVNVTTLKLRCRFC